MKILNNLFVNGTLTLGQFSNADLAALGTSHAPGTLIYNTDTQQVEESDGSSFVAFIPTTHPETTIGSAAPESAWLTTDSTQVLNLQIPAGGITATHLAEDYYTETEVDQKFSDLVGGAGAAYDTLQELATEIQNNDTDLVNLLTEIGNNDNDISALQSQAHDAVTLNTSTAQELTLSGQELYLDLTQIHDDIAAIGNDVTANTTAIASNDTEITALQAQAHDAVTLGSASDPALVLSGQELTLTLFNDTVKTDFQASDFVTSGSNLIYTFSDSQIEIGYVKSVLVLDSSNQTVWTEVEVKSGALDIIVNAVPNNSFDGSVVVTLIEQ